MNVSLSFLWSSTSSLDGYISVFSYPPSCLKHGAYLNSSAFILPPGSNSAVYVTWNLVHHGKSLPIIPVTRRATSPGLISGRSVRGRKIGELSADVAPRDCE